MRALVAALALVLLTTTSSAAVLAADDSVTSPLLEIVNKDDEGYHYEEIVVKVFEEATFEVRWYGDEEDLNGATFTWEIVPLRIDDNGEWVDDGVDDDPFASGSFNPEDLHQGNDPWHGDYWYGEVKIRFDKAGSYSFRSTLEPSDESARYEADPFTVHVLMQDAPGEMVVEGDESVVAGRSVSYTIRWIGPLDALDGAGIGWVVRPDHDDWFVDHGNSPFEDLPYEVEHCGDDGICHVRLLTITVQFPAPGKYLVFGLAWHHGAEQQWYGQGVKSVTVTSASGRSNPRTDYERPQEQETDGEGLDDQDTGMAQNETGPAPAHRFADVEPDHWSASHVDKLVQAGVISGYPDGSFRPEAQVTRYELAKMLAVLAQLEVSTEPSDHWAAHYVQAVVNAGLMTGTETGFDGDAVVTRAQIATIIARLLADRVQPGDLSRFSDAGDIPAWAVNGFAVAVGAGIMAGYPDGTLNPNAPVTRAEIAKILALLMDLLF